ncbi:bacterioferritin-associated ferredoxin [Variovorax boronicumulans]
MTFDEVQFELGVATQCGQCEGCARDIVAQCSASHPVAALNRESGTRAIQLASSITESKAWNSSRHSAAA